MISNRPTKYTFLYAYFCHLEEPLIIYFYYLAFCYSRGHLSFIDIWTSATCDATYHSFILVGFLPLGGATYHSFILVLPLGGATYHSFILALPLGGATYHSFILVLPLGRATYHSFILVLPLRGATYHSFILVGFLPLRWRSHISFISIIWALLQYFQITVTSIKCIMLYNIHTIYCPQWKLIKTNHYCYIPVKPSHNHHSFSTFKYIFLQEDLWHFKEIPIYINLHICIPMWMSVD